MDPTNHEFRPSSDELPPRVARLMAYLDGELPPEERARVEAWIAQDPEAYHQHEEERRRRDLFAAAPIPEPDAAVWDKTLAGITSAVFNPPVLRKPQRRSSALWVVVGVAAAAAIAAIWIGVSGIFAPPEPEKKPRPVVDLLEVATAEDVSIDDMDPVDSRQLVVGKMPAELPPELWVRQAFPVSTANDIGVETMEGDDTDRLVVGEPPVPGPLVMATPGDVREVRINGMKDKRQPMPYLLEPGNSGGMPMINVPLKTVRKD